MKLLFCMCRCLGSLHTSYQALCKYTPEPRRRQSALSAFDVYHGNPAVILALSGEKKKGPQINYQNGNKLVSALAVFRFSLQ